MNYRYDPELAARMRPFEYSQRHDGLFNVWRRQSPQHAWELINVCKTKDEAYDCIVRERAKPYVPARIIE